MKRFGISMASLASTLMPAFVLGQGGIYAYNSAENTFYRLKSSSVESTAIGPIVRTCVDLTYTIPEGGPRRVSFNFELPETSVLGGFGCFVGGRFVPGQVRRSVSPKRM